MLWTALAKWMQYWNVECGNDQIMAVSATQGTCEMTFKCHFKLKLKQTISLSLDKISKGENNRYTHIDNAVSIYFVLFLGNTLEFGLVFF